MHSRRWHNAEPFYSAICENLLVVKVIGSYLTGVLLPQVMLCGHRSALQMDSTPLHLPLGTQCAHVQAASGMLYLLKQSVEHHVMLASTCLQESHPAKFIVFTILLAGCVHLLC